MAAYLSLPIIQELVDLVERDPAQGNWVKALASSLLNHYFPPVNGWTVATGHTRNISNRPADSIILRIQRLLPGERKLADHIMVEAKTNSTDDLDADLGQLENAIKQSHTQSCWVVLFHGLDVLFYEYHGHLPETQRLIPTGRASKTLRNRFHVRRDSFAIEEMLMQLQLQTPNRTVA